MFVVGPRRIRWYQPMAYGRRCSGWGAEEPLLLHILCELSGKLAWLLVALKTSVRLLTMRAHLFLLRAFVRSEDFRLPETMSVLLRALGELQPDGWASLMHVSMSPKPVLQEPDPEVAQLSLCASTTEYPEHTQVILINLLQLARVTVQGCAGF